MLTTLTYRLDPELAGSVTAYPSTPELCSAWEASRNVFVQREGARRDPSPANGFRALPRRSLAVALRALLGDVAMLHDPRGDDVPWLVTREPVDPWLLRNTVSAWQAAATGSSTSDLADAVTACVPVRVDLGEFVHDSASLPSWAWPCAVWKAMRQLATEPLDLGYRAIALRLDTEGELLTWDDLVTVVGQKRTNAAMHRITGKLISMPGERWPLLRLDARISRVAVSDYKVDHAWIDLGRSDAALLRSELWRHRINGAWTTRYPTALSEALQSVSATRMPEMPADPGASPSGPVRLQHVSEGNHRLGTGPGQAFLGVVQVAADAQFGAARRLDLRLARMQFVRRIKGAPAPDTLDRAVVAAGAERLVVHVLPADAQGRERVRRLVASQLGADDHQFRPLDGEISDHGRLSVVFHAPTPALLGPGMPDLPPVGRPDASDIAVALVETSKELAANKDDPKPLVRRALAERNIASQFFDNSSTPATRDATDHPAVAAWRDALRSAGVFDDRLNIAVDLNERPTLLIGGHVTYPYGAGGIVAVLTALVVGHDGDATHWRAVGYRPGAGWLRYVDAVTDHHRSPLVAEAHRGSWPSASAAVVSYVDAAIDQLLREHPTHAALAFFDTDGVARRLWSGLTNKRLTVGSLPGGPGVEDRLAVVRLNSTDEVPQPVWHLKADGSKEMPTRLFEGPSAGTWLLINKSTSLDAFSRARDGNKATRFDVVDGRARGGLGDNWHALTATDITVVRPAAWSSQELAHLTARLCHQATSWDGRTSAPAPLHLAKQLYQDHPQRR